MMCCMHVADDADDADYIKYRIADGAAYRRKSCSGVWRLYSTVQAPARVSEQIAYGGSKSCSTFVEFMSN